MVYGEVTDSIQGQIDTPLDRGRASANDAAWQGLCAPPRRLRRAPAAAYGITLAYHHHMGAYVESPEDIDRLMAADRPAHVGLLFDTGHAFFGGATDPNALLARHLARVVHVHCKDVRPAAVAKARNAAGRSSTA